MSMKSLVLPGIQVGCALTLLQRAIFRSHCDRMGNGAKRRICAELVYQGLRYLEDNISKT